MSIVAVTALGWGLTFALIPQAGAAVSPYPVVLDSFSRTVSGSWGNADLGGAWKPVGGQSGSQLAVSGGAGTMTTSPGQAAESVSAVSAADTDQKFSFSLSALPKSGSGAYVALESRVQPDGLTKYLTRLRVLPTGAVVLSVIRQVGTAQTAVGSEVTVGTATASQSWTVESRVTGTTPVALSLRAYKSGATAPNWQDVTSDASAARLVRPGNLGVLTYLSSSATAPVTTAIRSLEFDDLQAPALVPALSLAASVSPTTVAAVNATLTYQLVVTNTGTVALNSVSVSADHADAAPVCPVTTLAAGGSTTCTASYTVTQADIDSAKITATATATAGSAASNLATVVVAAVQNPSLSLTEAATVTPAADQGAVKVGDTIAYGYALTDTGNVTLNSVGVLDPTIGIVSCPSASLAPAASQACTTTQTRRVTQADVDNGSISSTATATGTSLSGTIVTATSSLSVPAVAAAASLTLTSSTSPASVSAANTTITRSFTASNVGTVTLTGLVISDVPTAPAGAGSAVSYPSTTLAPGASLTCTSTYLVTAADLAHGSITDVATASATKPAGGITSSPQLATTVIAAAPVGVPGSRPALSAGALAVGAAVYPLPAGALYVSTAGSDSNPGSVTAPLRTLARAISLAPTGATIVLRAGEYNEADTIPAGKALTIQNYPKEAAYLDGATHVNSGWIKTASTWTLPGWTKQFDNTVTDSPTTPTGAGWGFVGPQNPLANHADGVWIDGVQQTLVASASAVVAGTFYADYTNHAIVLGTNPAGYDVKASNLVTALYVRGSGSTVQGIGIRDYADSLDQYGAVVIANATGVKLSNVVVAGNATYGIEFTSSPNGVVQNITADGNGLLGMGAYHSDNLTIRNSRFDGNNTHRFNQAPKSGGFKSDDTRTITVTNSQFDNNYGPGMWFDQSTYNVTAIGNDLISNTGHGVSFEISAKLMFVDNRVLNSGGDGLKLNDSNGISLYNNTVSGSSSYGVWAVQDTRVASNQSVPGHDSRQPFPDPTMTWILGSITAKNNVFGDTHSKILFNVQDNALHRTATQMGITLDGNVYARPSATSPSWLIAWATGATNPATYTSAAAFRTATGQEPHGFGVDTESINPDGSLTATVLAKTGATAQPLPAQIVVLSATLAGLPHLGAQI